MPAPPRFPEAPSVWRSRTPVCGSAPAHLRRSLMAVGTSTVAAGADTDWLRVVINDNGNSGGPAQTASAGVGVSIPG
jgi:hypothetical protein